MGIEEQVRGKDGDDIGSHISENDKGPDDAYGSSGNKDRGNMTDDDRHEITDRDGTYSGQDKDYSEKSGYDKVDTDPSHASYKR